MIVAAIVLFVAAVLIVGVTVAATGGLLPINSVAGIRYRYFMVSENAWQAGHHAALFPVTVGGAILAAGGVVLVLRPETPALFVVAVVVLFLVFAAWGVIRGNRAALDAVAAEQTAVEVDNPE